MPTVAVTCPNLFHVEQEGSVSLILTDRVVESREELDALLDKGVEIHARCYCGRSTTVTPRNAELVEPT